MRLVPFEVREFQIKEKCQGTHLEYLGPVTESSLKTGDKIKLKCLTHNHCWENTTVSRFLAGIKGCPKCRSDSVASVCFKDDVYWRDLFLQTGSFHPDSTFVRDTGRYWLYHCPVCSQDEFTANSLCNGVFRANSQSLRKGGLPCRCSERYIHTKPQLEYLINKYVDDYKYVGWAEDTYSTTSKIHLECNAHGLFECKVANVIYGHRRCPLCPRRGYNKEKLGVLYVLIASNGEKEFVGYGISNNSKLRLRTHRRNLHMAGYYIVDTKLFHGTGQEVFDAENQIMSRYECYSQDVCGFRQEALQMSDLAPLMEFLHSFSFSH